MCVCVCTGEGIPSVPCAWYKDLIMQNYKTVCIHVRGVGWLKKVMPWQIFDS